MRSARLYNNLTEESLEDVPDEVLFMDFVFSQGYQGQDAKRASSELAGQIKYAIKSIYNSIQQSEGLDYNRSIRLLKNFENYTDIEGFHQLNSLKAVRDKICDELGIGRPPIYGFLPNNDALGDAARDGLNSVGIHIHIDGKTPVHMYKT